jgi:DNA modification methylase
VSTDARLHAVHPYPCKFPAHVAEEHVGSNQVVLDPFCGSGTTLLVAAHHGNDVIGLDCNPIAVLISQFKLMASGAGFKQQARAAITDATSLVWHWSHSDDDLPAFEGRDHWFAPQVRAELAAILKWIAQLSDPELSLWLKVSLSAIVNRVSFQDGETRYARVDRVLASGRVAQMFVEKASDLLLALNERPPLPPKARTVLLHDIRDGIPLADGSVDLVITSPPYANTMDYYLYHKQRMNVLGFDFRAAQSNEIGSRHEFSSLKVGPEKWRSDYVEVLREITRVLSDRGRAVIVIGDSQIAGELVNLAALTEEVASSVGASALVLTSIPMAQRSRAFNPQFQRPNKMEHTIELRRLGAIEQSLAEAPTSDHDRSFPADSGSASDPLPSPAPRAQLPYVLD